MLHTHSFDNVIILWYSVRNEIKRNINISAIYDSIDTTYLNLGHIKSQ